jgi:serine/threonine-protein kinase
VPLVLPESGPAPLTEEEAEERKAQQHESERKGQEARKQEAEALSDKQALEKVYAAAKEFEAGLVALEEEQARRTRRRWRMAAGVGVLLIGLALFGAWRVWLTPVTTSPTTSEKGSSLVSTLSNSRPIKAVAAWLCATLTVGCPAAQVKPQQGALCPQEAIKGMEALGIATDGPVVFYWVTVDISQPGTQLQDGTYRDGPITSRVVRDVVTKHPLPEGTLLYGQLWTGPGILKSGKEAAMGRYTEAVLPDGRRFPVCFVLGDGTGRTTWSEGSKPGAVKLPRTWVAMPVDEWP